ncbi:MAG: antibiotic biosynthesis monooxygenase [Betaproteobacteria bacterium]|nr:antibiotic biosynthesis monooxygenase [Betaproteobacteria bacterium]
MALIRLIHIKVQADQAAAAERVWREDCAPLMIRQKGCISEKLLKCIDSPGEFISYAEWASEEDIERYRGSAEHKKIRADALQFAGAQAFSRVYSIVS